MIFRINKKPKTKHKKQTNNKNQTGFQFFASPPSDSGGVWVHGGSCLGFWFSAGLNHRPERAAQKTEDLSALFFYFCPQKKSQIRFSESWCDSVFCSSSGCLLTAETESVHMGIKRPTTLSFSSHTFCWSHLRFSVFFFSNTIQWVLRHFLQERKEQSVILCNNNKKNYCPLSRKKEKVSLRISVRWPVEAAGVSVKVRDANTHWRRAWELQQHPLTEVPWVHQNTQRLSPGFDCQPCYKSICTVSLLQILALLFSSHRLLELTAAGDGFLCSVYEKHLKKTKKSSWVFDFRSRQSTNNWLYGYLKFSHWTISSPKVTLWFKHTEYRERKEVA